MSSIIKSSQIVKQVDINKDEVHKNTIIARNLLLKARIEYDKIISSAKKEYAEIIEKASKEADVILSNSYKKSQKLFQENKQKGYEKGYEDGYNKGYNEGKEVADKLIKEANDIKKKYFNEKEAILANTEKDIINLVFTICEKVLNKKIEEDRDVIISLISKGINSLNSRESLLIRVSEQDYDYVEMSKDRILAMSNLVDEIDIKVDNNLEPGSCIIEGKKGSVDVSVNYQIEKIKELILDILNSE